jgi:hypothetical protein
MKGRIILVSFLVIGMAFLLSLSAAARQAGTQPASPVSSDNSPSSAFKADSSIYLPLVLNNYAPCKNSITLISPANEATLDTLVPLYKWDAGCDQGADMFKYQVSKDAGFSTYVGIYTDYTAFGPNENLSWVNLEPATRYYWRAWLVFGATNGPYTAVWSFITGSGGIILPGPSLVSPANNATLPSTDVTLRWNSLPGALQYSACWGKPGEFGYTCLDETGTQATPFYGIDPNTTYDWWVYARNNYAYGDDSVKWQFTTGQSGAPLLPTREPRLYIMPGEAGSSIMKKITIP